MTCRYCSSPTRHALCTPCVEALSPGLRKTLDVGAERRTGLMAVLLSDLESRGVSRVGVVAESAHVWNRAAMARQRRAESYGLQSTALTFPRSRRKGPYDPYEVRG